ncbi:hypothetical protein Tco_0061000, partial [Tanacetum coccineum]
RVFWGADEELSDGGSPRVIVYGYDGLTMQPVAPPSPDYVPGPEHPPSPDYIPGLEHPPSPAEVPYVLEPEYPEYLVPSDDEAPWENQPLLADASPVALSPGYVADSDLEEDHADYPADGGDEEDEHLASASSIVAPTVDYVPSFEETEPFETNKSATTPPSPLISLSPPSAEERLARCLATPALPSSPLPIVPHPYGSPNHVRAPPNFRAAMGRLRASSPSTHHPLHPPPPLPPPPSSLHLPPHVPTSLLLPSSPLPPLLVSLFIPPPVNRREDIPEAELPPHKRLCPIVPTSRYEVGESSTAAPKPTGGHRVDYGFIGTLDSKTRRQRTEEVGYGNMDVWVDL